MTATAGPSATNAELQKQDKYEALEETCRQLREERDKLKREEGILQTNLENTRANEGSLKDSIDRQYDDLSNRDAEIAGLRQSLSDTKKQVSELEGNKIGLQQSLDNARQSADEQKDASADLRGKLSASEKARGSLDTQLATANSNVNNLQAELERRASKITSLESEIQIQRTALEEAASNAGVISAMTAFTDKISTERNAATDMISTLRISEAELKKQKKDLQASLDTARQEMDALRGESETAAANSQSQVQALQETGREQTETIDNLHKGVRRLLHNGDQSASNLGDEDDLVKALHEAVMSEADLKQRQALQDEPGDFESQWVELLATRFQTRVVPRSLTTLLTYIAGSQTQHVRGDIDDLAHLQLDWLGNSRTGSESL